MSELGSIGRVSLAVEIDGKGYFVALPQERMLLLVKLAEGLFDGGKLVLKAMPADYRFIEIPVKEAA